MELVGEGIDEVLIELYKPLLEHGSQNEGSRGGMKEILGVTLHLTNPRARISRSQDRGKPFSALGELLWYLGGLDSLEFIKPYIPMYEEDAIDGVLPGAYGPRLYKMRGSINQLENVTSLLREKPQSKRAVIQLYDALDIATNLTEIPCTTAIQILIREHKLHFSVTMRSNDAYWGLPHDVFCFTMLQEMMAKRLGCELGEYYHYVGSMHVYEKCWTSAAEYVDEGHQKTIEMPPMPEGDPFSLTKVLLDAEHRIRNGDAVDSDKTFSEPYWADIVRLLQVFWATNRQDAPGFKNLQDLKEQFVADVYRTYLDRRWKKRVRTNIEIGDNGVSADVAITRG